MTRSTKEDGLHSLGPCTIGKAAVDWCGLLGLCWRPAVYHRRRSARTVSHVRWNVRAGLVLLGWLLAIGPKGQAAHVQLVRHVNKIRALLECACTAMTSRNARYGKDKNFQVDQRPDFEKSDG